MKNFKLVLLLVCIFAFSAKNKLMAQEPIKSHVAVQSSGRIEVDISTVSDGYTSIVRGHTINTHSSGQGGRVAILTYSDLESSDEKNVFDIREGGSSGEFILTDIATGQSWQMSEISFISRDKDEFMIQGKLTE